MKKGRFTLVEVMIAVALSAIAAAMMVTVVMNLLSVFRDGTIDYKMAEYGHVVRQKIIRTYGLRQAFWESLEVADDEISFFTVTADGDWPQTETITKKMTISLDAASINAELNDSDDSSQSKKYDFAMMGITIREIKVEQIKHDPADESSVNKLILHVLFEKVEGGRSYLREEEIHVTSLF